MLDMFPRNEQQYFDIFHRISWHGCTLIPFLTKMLSWVIIGKRGIILDLVMLSFLTRLIVETPSARILSSVFTYDIYKVYIVFQILINNSISLLANHVNH
jgi:hypothetical protein